MKKLLFITILHVSLAGCGFTTYNINSLPPQLNQVYYQTEHPYAPFEIDFKKRLEATGTKLLSEPKRSAPILNISSSYSSHTGDNFISSTQTRIYNLTYTAIVTISDFNNKQLLEPQVATVSCSITLQPNEVFEATPQIAIVKQEMQQELIIKILNILSAPKTFQALKSWQKQTI